MEYLLARYRFDRGDFGYMEEFALNEQAHVWWRSYNPDDCPTIADEDEWILKYSPNGQAGSAAFIAQYSELVPEDLYRDIIKYPAEKSLRCYDKASPLYGKGDIDDSFTADDQSPYNLKCYQKFVACLKDKPLADKPVKILYQDPPALRRGAVMILRSRKRGGQSQERMTAEAAIRSSMIMGSGWIQSAESKPCDRSYSDTKRTRSRATSSV